MRNDINVGSNRRSTRDTYYTCTSLYSKISKTASPRTVLSFPTKSSVLFPIFTSYFHHGLQTFIMFSLLLGTSHRPPLTSFLPPLASLFGIRLNRTLILRLSSLLLLRSLISTFSLPLPSSILSFLLPFALTTLHTSFFLSLFSPLSFPLSFLPAPVSPLLSLFSTFVLLIGPLFSLFESAILVYLCMLVSRKLTDRMYKHEATYPSHPPHIRRLLILSSLVILAIDFFLIFLVSTVFPRQVYLPLLLPTCLFLLFVYMVPSAQLLEAAMLSLYATLNLTLALLEHLDIPTNLLQRLFSPPSIFPTHPVLNFLGYSIPLQSENVRTAVLVYSMFTLLVALANASHFLDLVVNGYEAVQQRAGPLGQIYADSADKSETKLEKFLGLLGVFAITFRLLVWTGEVKSDEYIPLLVRCVQTCAIIVLYRGILGATNDGEQEHDKPKPETDIAGNIIEKKVH